MAMSGRVHARRTHWVMLEATAGQSNPRRGRQTQRTGANDSSANSGCLEQPRDPTKASICRVQSTDGAIARAG